MSRQIVFGCRTQQSNQVEEFDGSFVKIMPIAKSLEKLQAQLNAQFPNRSKVSDGAWGDPAHRKRKSDHNPNAQGYVTARDFTFDTDPTDGVGIDCHWLAKVLLDSKDPRIKYIIWNGRITTPDKSGWKTYSGINPHKHHLHLSVSANPSLYNDDSNWDLIQKTPFLPPLATENVEIGRGAKGEQVKQLQQKLVAFGFLKANQVDSDFGILTEQAVQRFQLANSLRADGIVGNLTKSKLGL